MRTEGNKKGTFKHLAVMICILSMLITGIAGTVQYVHAETSAQTIRVGCFPLNGFFEIAENESVSGYGAEYTDAVCSHAGWSYEYIPYSSWVDALEALSKNEIDILAPAQHTSERDALYGFDSFPIGTEYGALLALSTNDSLIYEDYDGFNQLNVGCVDSLVFLDDFTEYEDRNNFSVNLTYYKDTPALIAALNTGEVDAIVANMMVKTDSMKLLARFGAAPFYYMLSPGADALREPLNQVIDTLSSSHPEFQNELSSTYFSDFDKIPFSKEELDYIAQSETLNVACAAAYPPFSYIDENSGQIDGVDDAVLEKISEITGLQFSYEVSPFTQGIPSETDDQNIALIAGVENDADTKLHSEKYTNAYLSVSKYFVGLKDTGFDPDAELKIAVIANAETQISAWTTLYPSFTFEHFESLEECIQAVQQGNVDFMLGDRYAMENALLTPQNQNLHIVLSETVSGEICYKVPESENSELLVSVLNKAIRQISDSDKEMYISDHVQANYYKYTISDFVYQYRIQLVFVAAVLAAAAAALVFILRARRDTRRAIKENEMKLRQITNNINGGVIVLKENEGLEITYANDGFLELIGCTRAAFEASENGSYLTYVHPQDLPVIKAALNSNKKELSIELRVMKSDGSFLPALFNCTAGRKINGDEELYCVIMDMTEQNRLLEQLRIDNRRTELILERVEEIFYEVDLRKAAIMTSKSFMDQLGWTFPDSFSGSGETVLLSMWHAAKEDTQKLHEATTEMLVSKKPVSSVIRIEARPQNAYIWCEVLQHPILSADQQVVSVIGLIRDIDAQIKERERLIEQAQRDPLTGLYNKEAFEEMVTSALKHIPGENHALIFIDLDRFKNLNDTLGHMTGDKAICEAADKLKIIFSNYDILSRFGGDEFCVFVKNIPLETLRGKMKWLVEKIQENYHSENGSVQITCSCGIACTKQQGFDYQILMKHADEALYYSKETGRNRFTFYEDMV